MTARDAASRVRLCAALAWTAACAPANDTVFLTLGFEPSEPLEVPEGAGVVELPVRLSGSSDRAVIAEYRLVASEARNGCATPDFELAEGRVEFPSGETETTIDIWIGDDDLAETDERLELEVRLLEAAPVPASTRLGVVILDDDRTALIDARDFGALPNSANDQTAELQAAFAAAAASGRGVVLVAPGDYEVSEVSVTPGTTLSARGVRFHRPPQSPEDAITLRVEHSGTDDSDPTLVEGMELDGRREQQGPFREREREEAHLISLSGDAEQGGRIRAHVERVSLESGTGSGLWIGPDSDVAVCELSANSLWRDAVTAAGGATSLRLEDVNATATEGTGLWIGARTPGYSGSLAQATEIENAHIGAGDVELETNIGSRLTVNGLTMTNPPFRLDAIDGTVTIADSVLMIGLASATHNFFGRAHDVQIADSTLVLWESANGGATEESERTLAAVTLSAESLAVGPVSTEPGRLVFERCSFELSSNVEAEDRAYGVESSLEGLAVEIRSSTLASGFVDWFEPGCVGCTISP